MMLFSADFPLGSRAVSAVFEPPAARRTRDPVEKVCFPETIPEIFHRSCCNQSFESKYPINPANVPFKKTFQKRQFLTWIPASPRGVL